MGIFDFLFKRKKQKQLQLSELPSKETKFELSQDIKSLSDSEKINLILQGIHSIYDELRPLDATGERVSRLALLMEQLPRAERDEIKKHIEELDIDENVLDKLEAPKTIHDLAKDLKKSYGYTAARLRHLKKVGKVTRKRDPETNKFVYMKI